jgi:hypothetical protein
VRETRSDRRGLGRRALAVAASTLAALTLLATAAGSASASPGALRILLVEAQCEAAMPAATLRGQIVVQPGVAAVDFFNGALATPDVALLRTYDVVLAMGDCGWSDPVAIGNNLADYQDQGGVVVEAVFNWQGTGSGTVKGRWTDAGYSPYPQGALSQDGTVTLGPHDANNPFLAGVSSLSGYYRDAVALNPGATEIAKWSDGTSAVAYKGRAVAINTNLGDYSLSPGKIFSGDFARIFVNAGRAYVPGDLTLTRRKASARGKKLKVGVACAAGAACTGEIALDATGPTGPAAAVAKRGKKVHVGDATLSVAAGQTTTLKVRMSKRARKLLRQRGKLAAKATLTTKPAIAGSPDKVTKAGIKIRPAKKKKR